MDGKIMRSAKYDIYFLEAGLEQLENYLLSDEIYWRLNIVPPSGQPPYPEFTLGWMLLSLKRAKLLTTTVEEETQMKALENQIDDILTEWKAAWENKAKREFKARLFLWRDFLEDYRGAPSENYDRADYEVNRRVLIELLRDEFSDFSKAENELLNDLDRILRNTLVPGKFIWDYILEKGFPKEKFWYLYGHLPGNLSK